MSGYLVAAVRWHDAAASERYKKIVDESLRPFGGRYLVRGAPTAVLDGTPPERIAIIEFPDVQSVRDWQASDGYAPARKIREENATTIWQIIIDHA